MLQYLVTEHHNNNLLSSMISVGQTLVSSSPGQWWPGGLAWGCRQMSARMTSVIWRFDWGWNFPLFSGLLLGGPSSSPCSSLSKLTPWELASSRASPPSDQSRAHKALCDLSLQNTCRHFGHPLLVAKTALSLCLGETTEGRQEQRAGITAWRGAILQSRYHELTVYPCAFPTCVCPVDPRFLSFVH